MSYMCRKRYNGTLPSLPSSLRKTLWPHHDDNTGLARARGLGWTLAPAGSDPQGLHADLWGWKPKLDRVRFPHILWKRDRQERCTTQIVPRGFSNGVVGWSDYGKLLSVCSNAVVIDSEVLHRGGPTNTGSSWVSSCSIELCSASGWDAWRDGTGGTTADPEDPEYAMLLIAPTAI